MQNKNLRDAAYLFNRGQNQQAYDFLGAHYLGSEEDGERYRFMVWAPRAAGISLVGDFNGWDWDADRMQPFGESGIWYLERSGLQQWQRYKFAVHATSGETVLKADPFARHAETRPGTASIIYKEPEFEWTDAAWLVGRPERFQMNHPLNIYEMHLGSWRRHPDGAVYNYPDLAEQLGEYLVEMGYNAVEFMPVTEYPLDMSWGYQTTGYFAATSRYGTPDDLKYLINHLHGKGIAVILDWVPAHFPKDAFGLADFDGTPTYEYADERLREHKEWGTLVFDYGKGEVRSFLFSSAMFWLKEFHFDGLRVDAVSSMLYLNYGRDEEILNEHGGDGNLEALSFIKELNYRVQETLPGTLMIAEESTAWPKVTWPLQDDGLGFTHKWNMGWMNDTLRYFSNDYIHRPYHHNNITFSLTYAFTEQFILPFSHDEVVHGKGTLLQRMPGDYWRQFASLRTLFAYQMTHPGSKMNFMGNEFAPYTEWRYYEELEWFMLQYPSHRQIQDYLKVLNHLYLEDDAFWSDDRSWEGFQWLQVDDRENAVFAYSRRNMDRTNEKIVVLNLTPKTFPEYRLPLARPGTYKVILNSDHADFGGSNYCADKPEVYESYTAVTGSEIIQQKVPANGDGTPAETPAPEAATAASPEEEVHYLKLSLPPLAAVILDKQN